MKQKLKDKVKKPVTEDRCHHYWLIDSPTDRISKGVCKSCGEEKVFKNYFRDSVGESNTLVVNLPDTEPDKLPDIESDKESGDS